MCDKMIGVIIEDNAIIGARAVIKAGVTVGKNSVVAMGVILYLYRIAFRIAQFFASASDCCCYKKER